MVFYEFAHFVKVGKVGVVVVYTIDVIGVRVVGQALSAWWMGPAMEVTGEGRQRYDCFGRGDTSALSEEASCLQLCDSEVEL